MYSQERGGCELQKELKKASSGFDKEGGFHDTRVKSRIAVFARSAGPPVPAAGICLPGKRAPCVAHSVGKFRKRVICEDFSLGENHLIISHPPAAPDKGFV